MGALGAEPDSKAPPDGAANIDRGKFVSEPVLNGRRPPAIACPEPGFTDGNKRVAWAAAMVFLEINGIRVEATENAAVHMMLKVSAKALDVAGIAEFLEQHATHVPQGSETP